MSKINLILEFIQHNRMNDYFLNQAIAELKLGLRLSEYLNPDQMSRFKPDEEIKNDLLSPDHNKQIVAVDKLLEQMNLDLKSPENIRETLDYLVPLYLERNATEKDKRRRELQDELLLLDNH